MSRKTATSTSVIYTVDGVACIVPSSCEYQLFDNSAPGAGRVLDGNDTMYKSRSSQKRKLLLEWWGVTPAEISTLLQMFNPEYITVVYWDALTNTKRSGQFYVGDRSAPVKVWTVGQKRYSKVSFDIIER